MADSTAACTCGGTMSGNCETGMRVSAIAPAIVIEDGDAPTAPPPWSRSATHWNGERGLVFEVMSPALF
jgi:hypothetical protein